MAEKTSLKSNQLIIIGGGASIKEGIDKGLWNRLKGQFTIGLNYSYNFFNSTILCYVDSPFYDKKSKKEEFQKLPLVIGKQQKDLKILPNTITLKTNDAKYFRDIKLGIYKSSLVGLFALSLAIYLLDEGQIFILGYDYGALKDKNNKYTKDSKGRFVTHWYQNKPMKDGTILKHRGIGKINYFHTIDRANKDFGVYKDEKKVKIYNVSLNSHINIFEKISYDKFFSLLNNEQYDQVNIRKYIKEKLK